MKNVIVHVLIILGLFFLMAIESLGEMAFTWASTTPYGWFILYGGVLSIFGGIYIFSHVVQTWQKKQRRSVPIEMPDGSILT